MAPTANTTKTNPALPRRPQFQRVAVAFVIAGLGLGLCLAALPRLWAAAHRLPANGVLERLANGYAAGPAHLARAEQALENSLAVRAQGRTLNDLARINLHQALQNDRDGSQAEAWLAASAGRQERALARNPANAFGWLRLSHLALLRAGARGAQGSGAVGALLRARTRSPFYEPLLWRQLDFALLLWPAMQPTQRAVWRPQIAAAASLSIWRLAKLAEQRHAIVGVRQVLASQTAALAEFDRHYLQRIRP